MTPLPLRDAPDSAAGPDAPPGPGSAGDRAYAYAIRLLAQAPRTARALSERLERAGFRDQAEQVVARLAAERVLDDDAYAVDFVEARIRRRPLGRDALLTELEGRGIAADAARQALERAGYDESAAALAAASGRLPRLEPLPLKEQARRLYAFLGSRGFSEEAADAAVRRVLPPDGWD